MRAKVAMVLVLGMLVATATIAGGNKEVTFEGVIACAKCTLNFEDAEDCQSVLVVQDKKGDEESYYYLVENDVTEEFGHLCQGEKPAIVTGIVEEKDGKTWLTATDMKLPAKA